MKRISLILSSFLTASVLCNPCWGGQLEVLAFEGDPAPSGSEAFSGFGIPVLNDSSQIACRTWIDGAAAIIQADRQSSTVIARFGEVATVPTSSFSTFEQPSQSDSGHVAFFTRLSDPTVSGTVVDALYRGGTGGLHELIRSGDFLADIGESVELGKFGGVTAAPTINSSGLVGFSVNDSEGVFFADPSGLRLFARRYDVGSAPNWIPPDYSINEYSREVARNRDATPSLNDSGEAAFPAIARGGSSVGYVVLRQPSGGGGLDVAFNSSDLTQPAGLNIRSGGEAGEGGGIPINSSGQTLIQTETSITTGRIELLTPDTGGMATRDTVVTIVSAGASAPPLANGAPQVFFRFGFGSARHSVACLNDGGHVLFMATTVTPGLLDFTTGLFWSDGSTILPVVREGESAPDGNGTYFGFSTFEGVDFALNNADQVAIRARFSGTSGAGSDDGALLLWDSTNGIQQIAREGQNLLGRTIQNLQFSSGANERGSERSGLNNSGEVAFLFTLNGAGTPQGIGLWSSSGSDDPTPRDLSVSFDSESNLVLEWSGSPLGDYAVEHDEDLEAPWATSVITPEAVNSQLWRWVDPDWASHPSRFYRIRW